MPLKLKRGKIFGIVNSDQYCIFLKRTKNKKAHIILLNKNGDVQNLSIIDLKELIIPKKIPDELNELY